SIRSSCTWPPASTLPCTTNGLQTQTTVQESTGLALGCGWLPVERLEQAEVQVEVAREALELRARRVGDRRVERGVLAPALERGRVGQQARAGRELLVLAGPAPRSLGLRERPRGPGLARERVGERDRGLVRAGGRGVPGPFDVHPRVVEERPVVA